MDGVLLMRRDRAFLLEHLDEAKRILNYEADNTHLHEA
jgi:hypothetical protein|tara:strand:+ start:182 stop:295 length:114 start_codon:yes stop_codon:yes gene_type:complete